MLLTRVVEADALDILPSLITSEEPGPTFSLVPERWAGVSKAALDWIEACDSHHPRCKPNNPAYRPTRLIEIVSSKLIKLIYTSQTFTGDYAALSHCWGKTKALKLQSDTESQLIEGIEIDTLPNSYREAILVCLKLNTPFIWIDSLCILQDSKEDWEREAITMKDLYGNSYLNICTAAASDNTGESFAGRSVNVIRPPKITTMWDERPPDVFYLEYADLLEDDILRSPLRERAWVYQEWYLSPRSLILSYHQLWWHCRHQVASERYPNGHSQADEFRFIKDDKVLTSRPDQQLQNTESVKLWVEHVQAYMSTKLTKESDRSIAFSGIVQSFGESQKLTGTYLAGLWRAHLPLGLCWHLKSTITTRTSRYMAPSWTWASLLGPFEFQQTGWSMNPKAELLASLESASMIHDDHENPDGLHSVNGGYVTLRGHLMGQLSLKHDGKYFGFYNELTGANNSGPEFDEWDSQGPLITYMDNFSSQKYTEGVVEGASRRIERRDNYTGSFYYLPIVYDHPGVAGIVVYQPLHQTVFHRVAYYQVSLVGSATIDIFQRVTENPDPERLVTIL
ncbi:hypothetical protein ACHAPJ_008310 [Fusarium lateritium]